MMSKEEERIINITGNARNINGQPAIVAENVGTYFIEGLSQWEYPWEFRKIRVIGDLHLKEHSAEQTICKPVVQLL